MRALWSFLQQSTRLAALAYLSAVFEEVEIRRRNSTQKAPQMFRFDSTRFIGRIRPEVAATLTPGVESILFEVQIPTVFEHAWGVATHDLVYKTDTVDWRKLRLAAQLKSAVEQIELTIAGFQQNIEFVPKSPHPETDTKSAIVARFQGLVESGKLTAEICPVSWSRFADNVYSLVKEYGSSYKAPGQVEALIDSIEAELEVRPSQLRSGSLFQFVLGHINSHPELKGSFKNFAVVSSSELTDFYGIESIPKGFDFEA